MPCPSSFQTRETGAASVWDQSHGERRPGMQELCSKHNFSPSDLDCHHGAAPPFWVKEGSIRAWSSVGLVSRGLRGSLASSSQLPARFSFLSGQGAELCGCGPAPVGSVLGAVCSGGWLEGQGLSLSPGRVPGQAVRPGRTLKARGSAGWLVQSAALSTAPGPEHLLLPGLQEEGVRAPHTGGRTGAQGR